MSIATTVIGDRRVPTALVLTTRNMTTEFRRSTALNGRHDLQLAKTDMTAIGVTPGGPVVAEDIRNLQSWTRHGGCRLARPPHLLADPIKRAHDIADRCRRHAGIECRGVELGVT